MPRCSCGPPPVGGCGYRHRQPREADSPHRQQTEPSCPEGLLGRAAPQRPIPGQEGSLCSQGSADKDSTGTVLGLEEATPPGEGRTEKAVGACGVWLEARGSYTAQAGGLGCREGSNTDHSFALSRRPGRDPRLVVNKQLKRPSQGPRRPRADRCPPGRDGETLCSPG